MQFDQLPKRCFQIFQVSIRREPSSKSQMEVYWFTSECPDAELQTTACNSWRQAANAQSACWLTRRWLGGTRLPVPFSSLCEAHRSPGPIQSSLFVCRMAFVASHECRNHYMPNGNVSPLPGWLWEIRVGGACCQAIWSRRRYHRLSFVLGLFIALWVNLKLLYVAICCYIVVLQFIAFYCYLLGTLCCFLVAVVMRFFTCSRGT